MNDIEFTKVSSKGQVVIPKGLREKLKIREGTPLAVAERSGVLLLKKVEMPRIKPFGGAAKPFRKAAKSTRIRKEDVERMIKSARRR